MPRSSSTSRRYASASPPRACSSDVNPVGRVELGSARTRSAGRAHNSTLAASRNRSDDNRGTVSSSAAPPPSPWLSLARPAFVRARAGGDQLQNVSPWYTTVMVLPSTSYSARRRPGSSQYPHWLADSRSGSPPENTATTSAIDIPSSSGSASPLAPNIEKTLTPLPPAGAIGGRWRS